MLDPAATLATGRAPASSAPANRAVVTAARLSAIPSRTRRGLAPRGRCGRALAEHIADYRRCHGEDWRRRFWTRALRIASVRYRHPQLQREQRPGRQHQVHGG